MKMALVLHSGPSITALTRSVTYAWPELTRLGGCSLCASSGTTQETVGNVPLRAAAVNLVMSWTLPSSWSSWTSVNQGSGFQMPGVVALCGCRVAFVQTIASSEQSGWRPLLT